MCVCMYVCKTFFCFCATFIHFDFGHQEMLTMCYIINYVIKQITKELFRYIGNLCILASCIFLTKKEIKRNFSLFSFFVFFFAMGEWKQGRKEVREVRWVNTRKSTIYPKQATSVMYTENQLRIYLEMFLEQIHWIHYRNLENHSKGREGEEKN